MARYIGPKRKQSRRAGIDLGTKSNALKTARRLNVAPGFHGRKGTRKMSDYGLQLREKQKAKWAYGLLEKQFSRLYQLAAKTPAATGQELLKLLERRLDNVVYRLNFAPTRALARQLVSHGHVFINGKRVSIPSYSVTPNEIITISDKARKMPAVAALLEQKSSKPPKWLEREAAAGKVSSLPERDDIELDINEQLIVEYYSR